nr:aldo/keto reductase [Segetibacter sp.]
WVEEGLLDLLEQEGVGCIPFSPLAQGLLTNKYLKGIPEDSRAAKPHGYLQESQVNEETVDKIKRLNQLAQERGQTLAQMSLAWLLKDKRITSVLIGASKLLQLQDCLQCLSNTQFSSEELNRIEDILK